MRTLREIVIQLISERSSYITSKEDFISSPTIEDIKLYDSFFKTDVWVDKDVNLKFNFDEVIIRNQIATYPDGSRTYHESSNYWYYEGIFKQEIIPYIEEARKVQLNEKLNEKHPEKGIKNKINKI